MDGNRWGRGVDGLAVMTEFGDDEEMTARQGQHRPSLEQLLESGDLAVEILHPGGLEITHELAERCNLGPGKQILDVASGSGETACFLVETFGGVVVGVDASEFMVERAKDKAKRRGLDIAFQQGDAHALPFEDDTFDAVFSECTTCVLDKKKAIQEMVRVTRPAGRVGIHDLCWKATTPSDLKQRLADLESERPETLDGWKRLFEEGGLVDVSTEDKSELIPRWITSAKKQLGLAERIKISWKILRRWGLNGLLRIKESEQVFESEHLGYGVIVGTKPSSLGS